MEEKYYLYNGQLYSRSQLESKYGKDTDNKIIKHGIEEAYDYNGKIYGSLLLKKKYGEDYQNVIKQKGINPYTVKQSEEEQGIVSQSKLNEQIVEDTPKSFFFDKLTNLSKDAIKRKEEEAEQKAFDEKPYNPVVDAYDAKKDVNIIEAEEKDKKNDTGNVIDFWSKKKALRDELRKLENVPTPLIYTDNEKRSVLGQKKEKLQNELNYLETSRIEYLPKTEQDKLQEAIYSKDKTALSKYTPDQIEHFKSIIVKRKQSEQIKAELADTILPETKDKLLGDPLYYNALGDVMGKNAIKEKVNKLITDKDSPMRKHYQEKLDNAKTQEEYDAIKEQHKKDAQNLWDTTTQLMVKNNDGKNVKIDATKAQQYLQELQKKEFFIKSDVPQQKKAYEKVLDGYIDLFAKANNISLSNPETYDKILKAFVLETMPTMYYNEKGATPYLIKNYATSAKKKLNDYLQIEVPNWTGIDKEAYQKAMNTPGVDKEAMKDYFMLESIKGMASNPVEWMRSINALSKLERIEETPMTGTGEIFNANSAVDYGKGFTSNIPNTLSAGLQDLQQSLDIGSVNSKANKGKALTTLDEIALEADALMKETQGSSFVPKSYRIGEQVAKTVEFGISMGATGGVFKGVGKLVDEVIVKGVQKMLGEKATKILGTSLIGFTSKGTGKKVLEKGIEKEIMQSQFNILGKTIGTFKGDAKKHIANILGSAEINPSKIVQAGLKGIGGSAGQAILQPMLYTNMISQLAPEVNFAYDNNTQNFVTKIIENDKNIFDVAPKAFRETFNEVFFERAGEQIVNLLGQKYWGKAADWAKNKTGLNNLLVFGSTQKLLREFASLKGITYEGAMRKFITGEMKIGNLAEEVAEELANNASNNLFEKGELSIGSNEEVFDIFVNVLASQLLLMGPGKALFNVSNVAKLTGGYAITTEKDGIKNTFTLPTDFWEEYLGKWNEGKLDVNELGELTIKHKLNKYQYINAFKLLANNYVSQMANQTPTAAPTTTADATTDVTDTTDITDATVTPTDTDVQDVQDTATGDTVYTPTQLDMLQNEKNYLEQLLEEEDVEDNKKQIQENIAVLNEKIMQEKLNVEEQQAFDERNKEYEEQKLQEQAAQEAETKPANVTKAKLTAETETKPAVDNVETKRTDIEKNRQEQLNKLENGSLSDREKKSETIKINALYDAELKTLENDAKTKTETTEDVQPEDTRDEGYNNMVADDVLTQQEKEQQAAIAIKKEEKRIADAYVLLKEQAEKLTQQQHDKAPGVHLANLIQNSSKLSIEDKEKILAEWKKWGKEKGHHKAEGTHIDILEKALKKQKKEEEKKSKIEKKVDAAKLSLKETGNKLDEAIKKVEQQQKEQASKPAPKIGNKLTMGIDPEIVRYTLYYLKKLGLTSKRNIIGFTADIIKGLENNTELLKKLAKIGITLEQMVEALTAKLKDLKDPDTKLILETFKVTKDAVTANEKIEIDFDDIRLDVEAFFRDGNQKIQALRGVFKQMFKSINESELISDAERDLWHLVKEKEFNIALKNTDTINAYLDSVAARGEKEAALVKGIKDNLKSLDNIVSFHDIYNSFHLIPTSAYMIVDGKFIKVQSNKLNITKKLSDTLKSTLFNFSHRDTNGKPISDQATALKVAYCEFRNKYDVAKTYEAKLKLATEYLSKVTGIDPAYFHYFYQKAKAEQTAFALLTDKKTGATKYVSVSTVGGFTNKEGLAEAKQKYGEQYIVSDNLYRKLGEKYYEKAEPDIIYFNLLSKNSISGFGVTTVKGKWVPDTQKKNVNPAKWITQQMTTAPDTKSPVMQMSLMTEEASGYAFDFTNVNNDRKTSFEQTSHLMNTVIKNNWNLTKIDGVINDMSDRTVEQGSLERKDYELVILKEFFSGAKTYPQFIGQFGDKSQIYFIDTEKLPFNDKNENAAIKLIGQKAWDNNIKYITSLMVKADYARFLPGSMNKEKAEAFAKEFLVNFVLNKNKLDESLHGKKSNYLNKETGEYDFTDQVKRSGSTNSPGFTPNMEIDGGIGKTHKHAVANDYLATLLGLDKQEITNGVAFVTQEFADKMAISMGNILAQEEKYGKLSTFKAIWSDVVDGNRGLTKVNYVVIDNFAKEHPKYKQILDLMNKGKIDILSFESGTKKIEVGKEYVNELFDKKGNVIATDLKSFDRANDNFLVQTELRHETVAKESKYPSQYMVNSFLLGNSSAITQLWNEAQAKEMQRFQQIVEGIKGDKAKQDFMKKMIDNVQYEKLSELLALGLKFESPEIQSWLQKSMASYITKNMLERKIKRQASFEVPDLFGLRPMELTVDGKHVRLPEVIINSEGLRYEKSFNTEKEAMAFAKEQADMYSYMPVLAEDVSKEFWYDGSEKTYKPHDKKKYEGWEIVIKPEYKGGQHQGVLVLKKFQEWEVEEVDSKFIVPGEAILVNRTPGDNLHSHTFHRAKRGIEGAGNIIMTDRETMVSAGPDFDGDQRYSELMTKDKEGNVILNKGTSGLANLAFLLGMSDYKLPENIDKIKAVINVNAYNDVVEELGGIKKYAAEDFVGNTEAYINNTTGNRIKAMFTNLSQAFTYMKKTGIEMRTNITLPLIHNTGVINKKLGSLVRDKYNVVKNHFANIQNMAFDNAKDPKLEIMGINEQTSNMVAFMLMFNPDLDKATSREQADKMTTDYISAIARYLNTPIPQLFITKMRERKYIVNQETKSLTTIFNEIAQELKGKENVKQELESFKNLYYASAEMFTITTLAKLNLEVPKTAGEYFTAKNAYDKVMAYNDVTAKIKELETKGANVPNELRNQTFKHLDVSTLVKPNGVLVPEFEMAQLALNAATNNVFENSSIPSELYRQIAEETIEQTTEEGYEEFDRVLNRIITLKGLNENRSLEQIENKLKLFLADYKATAKQNAFINAIVAKTNGIQVMDDSKETLMDEFEIKAVREAFEALPEDIKHNFVVYSVYKYDTRINANKNFSYYFDIPSLNKIADAHKTETAKWKEGTVGKETLKSYRNAINGYYTNKKISVFDPKVQASNKPQNQGKTLLPKWQGKVVFSNWGMGKSRARQLAPDKVIDFDEVIKGALINAITDSIKTGRTDNGIYKEAYALAVKTNPQIAMKVGTKLIDAMTEYINDNFVLIAYKIGENYNAEYLTELLQQSKDQAINENKVVLVGSGALLKNPNALKLIDFAYIESNIENMKKNVTFAGRENVIDVVANERSLNKNMNAANTLGIKVPHEIVKNTVRKDGFMQSVLFNSTIPSEIREAVNNPTDNLMNRKMEAEKNLTGRDTNMSTLAEMGLRTSRILEKPMGKVGDVVTFNGKEQRYIVTDTYQITLEMLSDKEFMQKLSSTEQWTVEHLESLKDKLKNMYVTEYAKMDKTAEEVVAMFVANKDKFETAEDFMVDFASKQKSTNVKQDPIAQNKSITPVQRIAMNFGDGSGGNKMRPEFKGKTTMDLILSGNRTGTSRDYSKEYNKLNAKIGDVVEFFDSKGNKALVVITSIPEKIENIDKNVWSKREGWDTSVYDKIKAKGNYRQFTFKLLNTDTKQTIVEQQPTPQTPVAPMQLLTPEQQAEAERIRKHCQNKK